MKMAAEKNISYSRVSRCERDTNKCGDLVEYIQQKVPLENRNYGYGRRFA